MPLCHNAYNFFSEHLKEYPFGHLQIGVFDGFYVSKLARQYPQKQFYAIDPFIEDGHTTHITGIKRGEQLLGQEQEYYLNTSGLQNIKLFRQKSIDFVATPDMKIDSFLIDGSHHYEDVARDIQIMIQLCHGQSNCVVYFDDYANGISGVKKAVDDFLRTEKQHTVGRYLPLDSSSLIIKLDYSS